MKTPSLSPCRALFGVALQTLALAGAALLFVATPAQATMSDVRGLHAVPVPGKVVIDGDLSDWDLSGQMLMCYDVETLQDVYSAKVAVMYDDEALYVGIHWKTRIPLSNHHDPHYRADRAWAADCVQLRIKTDRISHVMNWCYVDRMEPGLFIDYGRDLQTPFRGTHKTFYRTEGWKMGEGAESAFRKDADGKGYVQELKIPWALITLEKKYKPGDIFNMGVELLYGDADWPLHRYADNLADGFSSREFFFTNIPAWGPVTLEPKGNLTLPTPAWQAVMNRQEAQGPAEIKYDLPEDARVTLAIEDKEGKRLRNLVAALPRKKGPNTEHWDGLDDNGTPLPPGEYFFKALYHQGVHTAWQFSFASPGNPTWSTPDGRGAFYSDHAGPQAVASAGDCVALAAAVGEAGKPIIGCDIEGNRLWGAGRPLLSAARASLATDGKLVWIALDSTGNIYRVDAATGEFAPWKRTGKDAEGHDFQILDLPVYDAKGLSNYGTVIGADYQPNMRSISVNNTLLAVALTKDNLVKLIDKENGDVRREVKIDAPLAVAFDGQSSLVVLAQDGQLHRVELKEQTVTITSGTNKVEARGYAIGPISTQKFPDGWGLAVDSKSNIYLSVQGKEQNVKVFSPKGQLLRTIGKPGGRPAVGKFDETGMLQPAGIAVDSKDRLWVTEEAQNPKRTSLWDIKTGKLIRDLIGTTSYSGAGSINPFEPTMAFSDNTVYKLDWEKGTYRPTWSLGGNVYSIGGGTRSEISDKFKDDLFPPLVHGIINRVVQYKGHTFVYVNGSSATGDFAYVTALKNGKWKSAAALGVVPNPKNGRLQELIKHPVFAGHKQGEMFIWVDKNGDERVQADEVTFAQLSHDGKPVTPRGTYWGILPDQDGTLTFNDPARQVLIKFPITALTADGGPVYDMAKVQILPVTGKIVPGEAMFLGGKEGRVYVNQSPLTAFDKDGKEIFTYPNPYLSVHGSHNAVSARPGLLVGPSAIFGVVDMGGDIGELFLLSGNLGENFLFTWDGLWVQTIFKDTRGSYDVLPEKAVRGMSVDATTAGGESFGGNFVRLLAGPNKGKTYIVNGSTAAQVIEVTGLDTIKRFKGKFTYTPAQYNAAVEFNATALAEKNTAKSIMAAKTAEPVAIDGDPAKWPELLDEKTLKSSVLDIQESRDKRFGRVALRYDAQNLYMAYWVFKGDGQLRNSGKDAEFLFKFGDNVDLMLGPDTPQAAKNPATPGNLRLLLSLLKGEPTAVLYEKTVPGTAEKDRVAFSSPWRTIYFDRVTQPGDVKVAVGKIARGYFVEAAIPWARLGVQPASGLKLRADFGILGADNGGTTTIRRSYWSNKSTNLVNDVPGEADLTPSLWGELRLE